MKIEKHDDKDPDTIRSYKINIRVDEIVLIVAIIISIIMFAILK